MTASTHDPETEFSFPAPHLTAARRASHARPPCRRPWSRSRRTATPRARDLLPRGLLRRPGLGAPLLCAALVPLTADAQTVPADWAAKPDAVKPGQSFRLLFVTSGNTHFPSPAAISSSTTPLRRRRQAWIPHSRMLYRADSYKALLFHRRGGRPGQHRCPPQCEHPRLLGGRRQGRRQPCRPLDGAWDSNTPRDQTGAIRG